MATDEEVAKLQKEIAKLEEQKLEAASAHRAATQEAGNDILVAQLTASRDALKEELSYFKSMASPKSVKESAKTTIEQVEQGGAPPVSEEKTATDKEK